METDPIITFLKSPDGKKFIEKHNAEYREKNTPGPNNTCKELGCGGKVVSKVSSLFRGQFYYHSPACNKCGRKYGFAENAPKVGRDEFERKLNQVYY